MEQKKYQPTPHHETMSCERSNGWKSRWILTTVCKPPRTGHLNATIQSVTTSYQGLSMWHPQLETRQQSDPQQNDTLYPKWPEDLKECALFGAAARSQWGGFPQSPVPPTRCLQPQSLVTGEMYDTLKVPQDFMWGVCQHRNVSAANATIEVVWLTSRIHNSNGEEPTHLLPTLPLFYTCALIANDDGNGWPLIRRRWCHWCPEYVDQKVQHLVPIYGEQHLTLWTGKIQWREESYESYETQIRKNYLFHINGSKFYALSSAQIERHSVTNWFPVPLLGAIAGSAGKLSK